MMNAPDPFELEYRKRQRRAHWQLVRAQSERLIARTRGSERAWHTRAEWDEDEHPRDEDGKFTSGGGGGGGSSKPSGGSKPAAAKPVPEGPSDTSHSVAQETGEHPGKGYSKDAVVKDGVIHTPNVEDAARALHEGKKVNLDQPAKVSVLLNKLGSVTKEMIEKGEKAPTFDLCNVTVSGTNLFCVESKGIPRVEMPQIPEGKEEDFIKHLASKGYKTEVGQTFAAHIRATQNELNGGKVAGIAKAMREEGFKNIPLFVSKDNYVLDGHHRWAAEIGNDTIDGILANDKQMAVRRVDATITQLLEEADIFTEGKGKVGVGEGLRKPK